MKPALIFLIKGLPLAIPIGLLGLPGLNGGSKFAELLPWVAMAVDLPWDISGIYAATVTILGHGMDSTLAAIMLWSGIIWTFVSICINCSLYISAIQKLASPNIEQTKVNKCNITSTSRSFAVAHWGAQFRCAPLM